MAGDDLCYGDAFFGGFVGKHGAVYEVSDGKDVGDGGAKEAVDGNEALGIGLDAKGLKAEVLGVGAPAYGDKDDVAGYFMVADAEFDLLGRDFCAGYFGRKVEGHSLAHQAVLELFGDILVEGGADSV